MMVVIERERTELEGRNGLEGCVKKAELKC